MDRARDALGRPLPPGVPGVEPVPEVSRTPHEALALARDLIREGRPFAAHEVLEGRWKECAPAERPFWQGLAQLAVALTHAGRGNAVGARRLLVRGAGHLRDYASDPARPRYGVDVERTISRAGSAVERQVGGGAE